MTDPGALSVTITDLAQQATLRELIGDHLQARGVGSPHVGDTALVVSELLTNAFEHGRADQVDIQLAVDAEAITVHLSHSDARHWRGSATPRHMPPPTDRRGRGLAIVHALATTFRSWIDPDSRTHNLATLARSRMPPLRG